MHSDSYTYTNVMNAHMIACPHVCAETAKTVSGARMSTLYMHARCLVCHNQRYHYFYDYYHYYYY